MNKLVRHNLVRGLPTKSFNNDHTCSACLKRKQHKASCKSKNKDETSDILKKFITEIENLKDLKVKIIRHKSKEVEEQSFIATIYQKTDPALLHFCLFLCFLSQVEPKKVSDALQDPSWVEAMQEELLQFKIQKMDVKSTFLYGTIDEEVYVMQPPGFQDPAFPAKVYKVEKAMYGLHQAPRAWYVLQKEDGIFLSQDKYIGDILKRFGYSDVKTSNTPMDKENPWGKDRTGKDVDLYLYRSMIGSLMYLTASRPDIMFVVYACARHPICPFL
nr:hypothetical protein [Tanacetum cinerariifolium]